MAKKETISEIREKPGMSNAGKYKNVKPKDFAGPNGTYPINTLKRAKSALKLAHFAAKPGNIVKNVLKKYPHNKIKFANGGDRNNNSTPETVFCEKNGIELLWGIGGENKSNSSSWILKKWIEKS